MRFAIVGEFAEAIFIAEGLHKSADHQVQSACIGGELAQLMTQRGVSFTLVGSSEEAILDPNCDAVLVATADVDQSIAMARQASQAGHHVLVIPPDNVSTAYSFELHLLLDESERGIVPLSGRWYVDRQHPVDESTIQQLNLTFPLDEASLERTQLRGIDALSGCGFAFSQVTALDMPGADGNLLSRSITLAASQLSEQAVPPAILTFTNDTVASLSVIIVKSSEGTSTEWATALPVPNVATNASLQQSLVDAAIQRLSDSDACQQGMEEFSNTLELLEGLHKSLRRRRTVDVHFDGVSERSAFKTQMTAIGCGVLTYLLFGLVAFLVIAQLANLPPWVLKVGRIVWLAPLVLFLVAQLLLPLSRERGGKADRNKE